MKSRTNVEWIQELEGTGQAQAAAIADLRSYLLRAALYSLNKHKSDLSHLGSGEISQLAEDVAEDALLAVLSHLRDFRSESQFTTWVYKFAVNFALVSARRERWKRVPLDDLLDQDLPLKLPTGAGVGADPERLAVQNELWTTVREVMENELTERQRQVLQAVVFEDIPLDEVARTWNSNRNATYKLLHDARRKLKHGLVLRGFQISESFEAFEHSA